MTLRAMASNDDRIIDYFRSISKGRKPSKSDSIIDFNVPDPIKVKLANFIENIETQTWHRLAKLAWMPFEEARKFARSLNLNSGEEWFSYCKGGLQDKPPKPKDIPRNPYRNYADKGWKGMGDWLGTGRIADVDREYWPYEKANAFVCSLNLKNFVEWNCYCNGEIQDKPRKPEGIPRNPQRTYKNKGWTGMGDWLGTGFISTIGRDYLSFKKARNFVHALNLSSAAEWSRYCKGELSDIPPKPKYIPRTPRKVYADKGWKSMGDWLGTGTIANFNREYWSFEKARTFARSLKLKNNVDWIRYCKGELPNKPPKPEKIPSFPVQTYSDKGWKGMGDWLGTGRVSNRDRDFLPFEDARAIVRLLKLESGREWRLYCKGEMPSLPSKPTRIPSNPGNTYASKGWLGMGDWLGTGTIAPQNQKYWPFKKAKKFAHSLNLKSSAEWGRYCKGEMPDKPPKPENIPVDVMGVYSDKGWKGMGDWLGTGTIAPRERKYLPFGKAREFARSLDLKNNAEWRRYCKDEMLDKPPKPDGIPAAAHNIYADKGWQGYGDWLGTGRIADQDREFWPYKKARDFVRSLNLKSEAEWRRYSKGEIPEKLPVLPVNVPKSPYDCYKNKGWVSWPDWLGK